MLTIAALVLPCLLTAPRTTTYARPADPQYVAMTHIRRTPAPVCEPLALAPLVDGPQALIGVEDGPMVPPVSVVPPSAIPLAWTPMDWPADSIAYGAFPAFGGSFGGGCCYRPDIPVAPPPIPEPPIWLLLALAPLIYRKESMTQLFTMLGTIFVIIASTVWHAYVLTILWAWFVVPFFHLAPLGIAMAVGLKLTAGMFGPSTRPKKDGETDWTYWMSIAFVLPLMVLGIARIAKGFL